jgi:hypothetical protein
MRRACSMDEVMRNSFSIFARKPGGKSLHRRQSIDGLILKWLLKV